MKTAFARVVAFGLCMFTVTTFAASTSSTKPIAVLDFDLRGVSVSALDANTIAVDGSLKVFDTHTTPLRNDGSLDLTKIRATSTPSLNVEIDLKPRGASALDKAFPKKSYSLDFRVRTKFLGMPEETEWLDHPAHRLDGRRVGGSRLCEPLARPPG